MFDSWERKCYDWGHNVCCYVCSFVAVCCITASGFKVMHFSRLVEKASIQFDSCRKKIPHRHCGAMTEQRKLLFTNTQLGQRQTDPRCVPKSNCVLRLGGFGIVTTQTFDIYKRLMLHKFILITLNRSRLLLSYHLLACTFIQKGWNVNVRSWRVLWISEFDY